MRVIGVYSLKGGVGKTSTAVNLAYVASRAGQRTLLWDLDPQAASTYLFRIRPKVKGGGRGLIHDTRTAGTAIKGTDFEGLDLLPADFTYRNMDLVLDAAAKSTRRFARVLAPLTAEYDTVVLDCPPGIGLVSENVMDVADLLAVPLIPSPLSLRSFDQVTEFVGALGEHRPAVLAFFSMVDRRRRLHRDTVATLAGQQPGIAKVSIPAVYLVEQMAVHRAPVQVFAPRSPVARAYRRLWTETAAHCRPALNAQR
jgi:cellulose biosynthesis protein BcsQ